MGIFKVLRAVFLMTFVIQCHCENTSAHMPLMPNKKIPSSSQRKLQIFSHNKQSAIPQSTLIIFREEHLLSLVSKF